MCIWTAIKWKLLILEKNCVCEFEKLFDIIEVDITYESHIRYFLKIFTKASLIERRLHHELAFSFIILIWTLLTYTAKQN